MFGLASNLLQSVTLMEDGNTVVRDMQESIGPKFGKLRLPERVEWREKPKNPTREALSQTIDFPDKSEQ